MGNGVVWRWRRLVLLLRGLRRPREAHVRARHGTQTRATGYAGGNGQGLAGRGPRIGGRPRRTPGSVVDETSHGDARLRGKEAMSPPNVVKSLRSAQNSRFESGHDKR